MSGPLNVVAIEIINFVQEIRDEMKAGRIESKQEVIDALERVICNAHHEHQTELGLTFCPGCGRLMGRDGDHWIASRGEA